MRWNTAKGLTGLVCHCLPLLPVPAAAQTLPAAGQTTPSRTTLDNGAVVLTCPVAGAKQVAVETFYRVGFLDEPADLPQVSHLVEHLVCQCATASHPADSLFSALNQLGMTNAETLPDFTHYDYLLPPDQLEQAFIAEAQRLTSLRIEAADIAAEAPKAHAEAEFVLANPRSGMIKHAFIAFNQGWRHGVRHAKVRSGMERFDLARIKSFHAAFYTPANLTVVVCGAFDRDETLRLARKHLGTIPASPVRRPDSPDWARLPREITIEWDSSVRAVCVAAAPPDSAADRLILSLWGNLLFSKLAADADCGQVVDAVFVTNQSWAVGALPFFLYANAKPGVDPAVVRTILSAKLDEAIAKGTGLPDSAQIRLIASILRQRSETTAASFLKRSLELSRQNGTDARRTEALALGNLAIQAGLRELNLGPDGDGLLQSLEHLSDDKLRQTLRRCLDPSRRFTTLLLPEP